MNDADATLVKGTLSSAPHLELKTEGVRACLFVQCRLGSTGASAETGYQLCSNDQLAIHHSNGLLGCCLSEPGEVNLHLACSVEAPFVTGYIIVDDAKADCTEYEVKVEL
jgi:hypothetical protein